MTISLQASITANEIKTLSLSELNPEKKQDSLSLNTQANTSYILVKPWVRQSVAPLFFFSASALTWNSRKDVRTMRNRYIPDFSNHLDDYMQYAPAAAVLGLNVAGVKGRNRWDRAAINWGAGMLIMGAFVNSIKYTAKVERPDGTTRNSFPSGHTSTAFMNATFLHKEYGHVSPAYSIAGYAMSSFAGVERSLNNRHWISDILAGAGIGILSTELAYLIVDHFYQNKGDFFSGFSIEEELENPSFVSVRMGYSFSFDASDISPLGLETAVEGAYFLNKKWGIGGEITFGNYPFPDKAGWTDDMEADFSEAGVTNPKVTLQSIGLLNFMAGPHYAHKLSSKFMLQAKAMTGIMIGPSGLVQVEGEIEHEGMMRPFNLPLVEYKPRLSWVGGVGVSLTGMVAPRIGLNLFVDYKYANPTFDISPAENFTGEEFDDLHTSTKASLNNISTGLRLIAFF